MARPAMKGLSRVKWRKVRGRLPDVPLFLSAAGNCGRAESPGTLQRGRFLRREGRFVGNRLVVALDDLVLLSDDDVPSIGGFGDVLDT